MRLHSLQVPQQPRFKFLHAFNTQPQEGWLRVLPLVVANAHMQHALSKQQRYHCRRVVRNRWSVTVGPSPSTQLCYCMHAYESDAAAAADIQIDFERFGCIARLLPSLVAASSAP